MAGPNSQIRLDGVQHLGRRRRTGRRTPGVAGVRVPLGYLFVERNGTPAQKQQIIDVFVLGKEISDTYPMVAMAAVSVCVILAQRSIYKRRTAVLSGEVDRLSAWKTAHQEKEIGDVLHHSRQEGNR